MKNIEEMIIPYDDKTFNAMLPGTFVRYIRGCLIWQLIRLIVINIKMLKVVAKSH
jgi:hypothetical protein